MYSFKKSDEPLVSLGIGKKALITRWLDEMGVINYIINDDYTIDVEGNVYLYGKGLDKFPEYIKFGRVGGSFDCSNNQLVSLEGCPVSVGGSFDCSNNQLVSLEGCPVSVGGRFDCRNNQLVSLEGCPVSVSGSFSCSNNHLVSLEGCPKKVSDSFYCSDNKKRFSKEEVKRVCKVNFYDICV